MGGIYPEPEKFYIQRTNFANIDISLMMYKEKWRVARTGFRNEQNDQGGNVTGGRYIVAQTFFKVEYPADA